MEEHREEIWNNTLIKYPETYDGKVLILDRFESMKDIMMFELSFIRFSRTLTLVKTGQHAPGLGVLGFQAIIFSPDMNHVLAGIRTRESQYCPLFHSTPGGILEVEDTVGDFENACMREIEEEVDVTLENKKHLVAMMSKLHGTVDVVAVISGVVSNSPNIHENVVGNEEWKDSELSWYNVDRLDNCTPDNSLQGLLFVKEERIKFRNTRSSVLWS